MAQSYLEIMGPKGVAKVPLEGEAVTVGRNKGNMVPLEDDLASRFHCVIEKVEGGYRVRDLGARNGTKLNGTLVKAALLTSGDVITVGRTGIKVVLAAHGAGEHAEEVLEIDASQIVPEVVAGEAEVDESDPEAVLRRRADSMAERPFDENQIVLINARGGVAHPSTPDVRKRETADSVMVFRLLLLVCFRGRASDIHIEPKENEYQVRIRVDGSMVDAVRVTRDLGQRLMALVKVLGDIDIAQRNIVQEGHFSSRVPKAANEPGEDDLRRVDYRISYAPSVFGQKLVIRIQDTAYAPLKIEDLQLPTWMAEELRKVIELDAGMVLAVGPTGSGKTTTLYSLLRSINVNDRNVVTIEDPVEIQIEGITQLPVVEGEEGKSFLNLLRSVLRQDPDVILVGEIRDAETARTAMQAAITGHLVFSTLHTKDSLGTIFRLLDLGVEPYMLSQGLQTILAQRLVRQLCPHCKRRVPPTPAQAAKLEQLGLKAGRLYIPQGCPRCLRTGFFGRRAIFELLTATEELRDAISRTPTLGEVQNALVGSRFVKLQTSAYELVAQGVMAFDEVDKAMR